MLYRYALVFCALALSASWSNGGRAEEPPANAAQEFLVLRNGEVLTGTISRDGDRYVVAGEGSQMRFPSREVDFTCRTLDEAYALQERRVVAGRIDDRLTLADWCLRQGLTGYAARELSAAMVLDARHPRVLLLEGRLQRAIEGEAHASAEANGELAADPPADKSNTFVSAAELERQMRAMPLGTVEAFTTSIQPLLLRSCATAGCHGPGSTSSFTLVRPPMGSPMPRRLTQRNLSSTLALVDRQRPLEGKLLSAAKDSHGPNQVPGAVGLDAAKYQELVAWVWQTCNGKTAVPPTLAAQKAPQPAEQSPVLAAQMAAGGETKPPSPITKKTGPAKRPAQPIAAAPGNSSSPPAETPKAQASPPSGSVTPPN